MSIYETHEMEEAFQTYCLPLIEEIKATKVIDCPEDMLRAAFYNGAAWNNQQIIKVIEEIENEGR